MEQEIHNQAEAFLNQFDLKKHGFYNAFPFSDGSVGFSVRKDYKKDDSNSTQLSIYVNEDDSKNKDLNRRQLIIRATYGFVTRDGGIRFRSDPKIGEPIDLESNEGYAYDVQNKKFYKDNEEISPVVLINEIYNKHIKPTKYYKGLWIRLKVFFWRIFLRSLLDYISNLFSLVQYIISGDKYSFAPFFEEEKLNGKTIKSRLAIYKNIEIKEEFTESEKINFFNFKVKHWPILFYSFFHGIFFVIFMMKNYKPVLITTIFKNNFLTVIYIILSIWILETLMPVCLMFLIRFFSKLAFKVQIKKLSI